MGTLMDNNSAETARLLEQARAGNKEALSALFSRHRPRLRRMVELRLDRRLQARIDASDVIQEAYVEVVTRLNEYLSAPSYPLFLWLRLIVGTAPQIASPPPGDADARRRAGGIALP